MKDSQVFIDAINKLPAHYQTVLRLWIKGDRSLRQIAPVIERTYQRVSQIKQDVIRSLTPKIVSDRDEFIRLYRALID